LPTEIGDDVMAQFGHGLMIAASHALEVTAGCDGDQ
jgi:hypothetical protein